MTQDFTGTFDDIEEAIENAMAGGEGYLEQALTQLRALREAIPKDLEEDLIGCMKYAPAWPVLSAPFEAAAILASADRGE